MSTWETNWFWLEWRAERRARAETTRPDDARCPCGDIHGPLDWCDYIADDTRQRRLEGGAVMNWFRTRRALHERIRHLEDKLGDERNRAAKASEAAGYWAGQYNRVAVQRDEAIALAKQATAPTEPASDLAPPPAASAKPDPERLDEAMHRRDYYQHRAEAEANRARFAEAKASLDRCMDHAQALLRHAEAVAVQRQVAARLSTEETPMLCDNVNPFNERHRCTLGLGHPREVAHTDGDATWLWSAPLLKAWLEGPGGAA